MRVINKKSSVITEGQPKMPTPDQLMYGEIAVNYADGYETLAIKNSSNEIVRFVNKEYIDSLIGNALSSITINGKEVNSANTEVGLDGGDILIGGNVSAYGLTIISSSSTISGAFQTLVNEIVDDEKVMSEALLELRDAIDNIVPGSSLYSAYIGHVDDTLENVTGTTVVSGTGDTALCFIFHKEDNTYELITVDIETFIEENEFGDGLQVNNHIVSVKKDSNSEAYLTVGQNGVSVTGITSAISSAVAAESARSETAYLKTGALADYYNSAETESAISTALGDYYDSASTYTKSEVDSAIAAESARAESTYLKPEDLGDYYTSAQTETAISNALGDYYTSAETESEIEDAVSAETARAMAVEEELRGLIGDAGLNEISVNDNVINSENTAITIDGLDIPVGGGITRSGITIVSSSSTVFGALETVVDNIINNEKAVSEALLELHDGLSAETTRATGVESSLSGAIAAESARAESTYLKQADLSNYYTSAQTEATYVKKNGTDSLMTQAERAKLSGISEGAEVNVQSDWNETATTSDAYILNKPNLTGYFDYVTYVSSGDTHNIVFKNGGSTGTTVGTVNADDFIKDGMVSNVVISGNNLVITFNEDSGKQDISIPLTDIFNPANYYTKAQTYSSAETNTQISDAISAETARTENTYLKPSALTPYYTSAQTESAISTALGNYYTSANTYTKSEADSAISSAVAAESARSEGIYLKQSDLAGYYTSAQTSGAIETAVSAETVRAEATYAKKTDLNDYYTSGQTDNQISLAVSAETARATGVENELRGLIANAGLDEISVNDNVINSGNTAITVDALDIPVGSGITRSGITVVSSSATVFDAVDKLVDIINDDEKVMSEALLELHDGLSAETTRATGVESSLSGAIAAESARAESTYLKQADLSNYYTSAQTNGAIDTAISAETARTELAYLKTNALNNYYDSAETESAISTALGNYYTSAQTEGAITSAINAETARTETSYLKTGALGDYYTSAQTDTKIASAITAETARTEGAYVKKNGTDSLMTQAEHTKLSGISDGAEVNVQADWSETSTTSDAYIQNKPSLTGYVDYVAYESGGTGVGAYHNIVFKNGGSTGTTISTVNADDFIKDGMVSNVEISSGNLVITFNEDAGHQDISIPLTDIFDPTNYYTSAQTYSSADTYTSAQTNSAISTALGDYYDSAETTSAINTATSGLLSSVTVNSKTATTANTQITLDGDDILIGSPISFSSETIIQSSSTINEAVETVLQKLAEDEDVISLALIELHEEIASAGGGSVSAETARATAAENALSGRIDSVSASVNTVSGAVTAETARATGVEQELRGLIANAGISAMSVNNKTINSANTAITIGAADITMGTTISASGVTIISGTSSVSGAINTLVDKMIENERVTAAALRDMHENGGISSAVAQTMIDTATANMVTSSTITSIVSCTQTVYDNITKDPHTLYIIVSETT